MLRPKFANSELYHIYNRGVDKRIIFKYELDYRRFLLGLFLFNDERPVLNTGFYSNYGSPTSIVGARDRKLLVDVLCFCLMPNHFHLVLRQRINGGVSKFLQKLGTGFTNYFNQKYKRDGVLFQGKSKAIHIKDDNYFKHLTRYIHLNPVELIEPDWKEKGILSWSKTKFFLRSYRWSSYNDYLLKDNFAYLLNRNLLKELFDGNLGEKHEDFLRGWTQKALDEIVQL